MILQSITACFSFLVDKILKCVCAWHVCDGLA